MREILTSHCSRKRDEFLGIPSFCRWYVLVGYVLQVTSYLMTEKIDISAFGEWRAEDAPRLSDGALLDVLREQLHLTGTKEGCGEGECGACTVLIDGKSSTVVWCRWPRSKAATIKTIEGIAVSESQLHAVQQAFIECGGAQCGICTPGMVIAAVNLLEKIAESD